ncbi:MAG: sulfatase-like hydrolase/transferase [Armatimonadota bacterium]
MAQPDILVFISDQHHAGIMGSAGDPTINTPNLDRFAGEGMAFRNAYTACPLCVPARAALMTGQLPSRTGILSNGGIISSEQTTFAHALAAAGYETVLCGRMHFLGPDQFHGFTRRFVGDFTPCFHGRGPAARRDLGPYVGTPAGDFAKLYGGGTSPVLEYDRAVVRTATEYLQQPHDRPILLVVGTYGPHHTFVAPPDLYRKYLALVPPPAMHAVHPALEYRKKAFDADLVHRLRAAYYGLVEHTDQQLGMVLDAWQAHLNRSGRRGTACYLSDHGEHAGECQIWGKLTFYESSVRIPLLFAGDGVQQGVNVQAPCSIIDLGPTLCALAGVPTPPEQDGISLLPVLAGEASAADRLVISELVDGDTPARMVRHGEWKYIAFAGFEADDELFHLPSDPGESCNCRQQHPDIARQLRAALMDGWDPELILREQRRRAAHWRLLAQWGGVVDVPEPYRWPVPESSWQLPEP